MSNLKRRTRDHENGVRSWALYGRNGVISWGMSSHTRGVRYAAIAIHSPCPRPSAPVPVDDCPFLEMACHWDGSFRAGERLGIDWRAAGCDDEVIWRELGEWYASHLGEVTS